MSFNFKDGFWFHTCVALKGSKWVNQWCWIGHNNGWVQVDVCVYVYALVRVCMCVCVCVCVCACVCGGATLFLNKFIYYD